MLALVVEDDVPIRRLVRNGLERQGIDVTEAGTVEDALCSLAAQAVDVVILDLKLPDGSGTEVLAHLREIGSACHVIVLSGSSTENDRVRALERGADDYVVKPFFARELCARVLAVQRRQRVDGGGILSFTGLEIDLRTKQVSIDGAPVELTAIEFSLLAFLAARPGHVFSRAHLLRVVWQSDPDGQDEATVTEHIRRLRKKIARRAGGPSVLHTVRGSGYRFDPPGELTRLDPPSDPAVITFVDNVVVHADDEASKLLERVDAAGLTGQHISELISEHLSPGSVDAAARLLDLVIGGAEPRSQVLQFAQRSLGDVAIEVTTSRADWEGHAAIRVDLRRATDESIRLRHLFTGVLSDLADAVIVTDMQGHIRSWNLGAERVYGWTEAEVLGRHNLDVVVWASGEADLASAAAQLDVTGRWHGEGHQLTRDGTTIAIRGSTNIVRDEAGDPIGIVSVNRPVDLDTLLPQIEPSAEEITDLRRGIEAGELVVYYQPVVSLDDLTTVTVEALVRWRHPTRGLLNPDCFIPLAERSGTIRDIGIVVLDEACRQVSAWRRDGLDINLSVNISTKELTDPDLVDRITATASSSGFDLAALWLEVTESALVEDVEAATRQLQQLTELGIGISIDDFGTGWASLTYLRQFPIHLLKIDRSFVTGIDHDPSSAAIARSVISLAGELDLFVVAEGIETEAEAKHLRRLGCRLGQGYLYGHPVPASEIDLSRFAPMPQASPPASPERARQPRARHEGPSVPSAADAVPTSADHVAEMTRQLLRIRAAPEAAALLRRAVERLGGTLGLASDAGPDAIPIDLALTGEPMLFATVPPESKARAELQRILPLLVDDARQAVALLHRHERLTARSHYDGLTGLANRRVFEQFLTQTPVGVIIILELNRPLYPGQTSSDALVATFGGVLTQSAGPCDLCTRVGPQEFVVITPEPDLDAALQLVGRVRDAWARIRPEPVTLSIGAAEISDGGGSPAFLAADRALSRSKQLGPDHTEITRG